MAVVNQVGNALTGSTGSGLFVGATSPTLVTPVLGAASATSISFSSTSGIIGTTTNDSPAAGSVGEIISNNNIGTAILTGTDTNMNQLSLTAGDWDVYAAIYWNANSATTRSNYQASLSSTSATQGASYYQFTNAFVTDQLVITGGQVPTQSFKFASTTTVYLVAACVFTGGTMTVNSSMWARRRR